MTIKKQLSKVSLVTLSIAMPLAAHAQATPQPPGESSNVALEEIVITAERRSADLQKTAISITAITGDELAAASISNYHDATQNVPGLQFQYGQGGAMPSDARFAIRGLGTDGLQNQSSVTTLLDGVILGGTGAEFYDVSRVEVLRGPQGTLYGGNAPAGNVNIVTNNPSLDKFGASYQLDVGNYATLNTNGMVNLPLSDTFAIRVAANRLGRHNYADSSSTGQRETSERVKLLYQPSQDFSLLIGTEQYQYRGVGVDGFQAQDPNGELIGPYLPNFGTGRIQTQKYYANLTWNIGFGTLTYIPAYQHLDQLTDSGYNLPGGPASNLRSEPFRITRTQELRLASNPDSYISWIGGLYYFNYNNLTDTYIGNPLLPKPITLPQDYFLQIHATNEKKSKAAYGQATLPITSKLRVTAGLRYTEDDIKNPQTQTFTTFIGPPAACARPCNVELPFADKFYNLSYLGRIEADVADKSMVYALVATGYRPGGPGSSGYNFESEKATNYEVGSKNNFMDDKLRLNGSVYYTNYPAYQNEADDTSAGFAQSDVVSIGARFLGVELEAAAQATANDKVTLSVAYEKAKYTDNAQSHFSADQVTTDGKTLPHAPEWSLSGSYAHTFPLPKGDNLIGTLNGHYVTKQALWFDPCLYDAHYCGAPNYTPTAAGQLIQDAYRLVDASLAYHSPSDTYSLTAYARNLTNEVYKVGYNFNNASAALGAPRTYGMVFSAKW